MSKQKKKEAAEPFSLEEKLRELREILQKMQGSNQDFDENIKLFTKGSGIISACRGYLDEAEMSVKKLIEGESGAELEDFD